MAEIEMHVASADAGSHPLAQRLAAYGCTNVIRLDEKLFTPAQLDYLDLLPKQSNHHPVLTAVAEHQGTALLYLVDASSEVKSDAASLTAVSRQLANRSDPAWLGVIRPGSLEIFPIGFHEAADTGPIKTNTLVVGEVFHSGYRDRLPQGRDLWDRF